MLAGAAVLVPWGDQQGDLLPGFLWGMVASVLHAAIVLINRRMVKDYPGNWWPSIPKARRLFCCCRRG